LKILIIDDSSMLRDMLSYALNEGGYSNVTECVDGIDALKKINEHQFDLIITDINMPNMDGISLTKEVRQISNYDGIPILILSTENSDEIKEQGKNAGANGWIVKPFAPKQLIKAVDTVLNK
jgi:two-component system chemotaxis response regulator CheY